MVKIKNKVAIDTDLPPCKPGYERVPKLLCEPKCKKPRKRDPSTNQCSTSASIERNKQKSKKSNKTKKLNKTNRTSKKSKRTTAKKPKKK